MVEERNIVVINEDQNNIVNTNINRNANANFEANRIVQEQEDRQQLLLQGNTNRGVNYSVNNTNRAQNIDIEIVKNINLNRGDYQSATRVETRNQQAPQKSMNDFLSKINQTSNVNTNRNVVVNSNIGGNVQFDSFNDRVNVGGQQDVYVDRIRRLESDSVDEQVQQTKVINVLKEDRDKSSIFRKYSNQRERETQFYKSNFKKDQGN